MYIQPKIHRGVLKKLASMGAILVLAVAGVLTTSVNHSSADSTPPTISLATGAPTTTCTPQVITTHTAEAINAAIDATVVSDSNPVAACPFIQLQNAEYDIDTPIKVDQNNITLQGYVTTGTAGTTIKLTGTSSTVIVSSMHVTLNKFNVVSSPGNGILVNEANDVYVHNVSIASSGNIGAFTLNSTLVTWDNMTSQNNISNGFDMHGSVNVTVQNSTSDSNGANRAAYGKEGNGILVYASNHVHLRNNLIYDNSIGQSGIRDGIRVTDYAGGNDGDDETSGYPATSYVIIDYNTIEDGIPPACPGTCTSVSGQHYAVALGASNNHVTPDMDNIWIKHNTDAGHPSMNPSSPYNNGDGIYAKALSPTATQYWTYDNSFL